MTHTVHETSSVWFHELPYKKHNAQLHPTKLQGLPLVDPHPQVCASSEAVLLPKHPNIKDSNRFLSSAFHTQPQNEACKEATDRRGLVARPQIGTPRAVQPKTRRSCIAPARAPPDACRRGDREPPPCPARTEP